MTKDLDALAAEIEAGLESVTPGDWGARHGKHRSTVNYGPGLKKGADIYLHRVAECPSWEKPELGPLNDHRIANAAHIASCSPETMRALLAERKQMKAALTSVLFRLKLEKQTGILSRDWANILEIVSAALTQEGEGK